MKEKIPEELRKEFEHAVLNADVDHWLVDNDRQFLDKIWDAVDKLFNQEVERRIAERMPSEELIEEIQEKSLIEYDNAPICEIDYYSGFEDGIKWLRSRLIQKTEGGEG